MRNMMMKTAVLAGAALLVCGCVMTAKAETRQETVEKVQEQQEIHLKEVGITSRKNIQSALNLCERNGETAAKYLNKIKGRRQEFETGVREVLNEYYSMEKSQRGELGDFEESLDGSAQEIIAHYEEAEEERENSENLDYQTEEVLVTFPYGTSEERIEEVVQECAVDYEIIDSGELEIDESLPEYKKERLEKIKDYKTDVVILAKLGLEDTVARAEEKFEEYGCVVDADENTFLEADGTIQTGSGKLTTTDPKFNKNDQWNMITIDIPKAYRKFQDQCYMLETWVAVIDCGVQMNHPDLKGNLMTNYSVDVTQNNKKLIECEDKASKTGQYTASHGTMVASVIAARANNGKFGAGVANAANEKRFEGMIQVMAIKCDNSVKKDRHVTKGFLATAINKAVSSGADVINISYSAPKGDYGGNFSGVEKAIRRAIKADVCVVASAGNDGETKGRFTERFPASFDGVISVGATTRNNTIASYSNRSDRIDILAPVGNKNEKGIFCLQPTTINKSGADTGHGTSYAAPQVAATAAMMKSINYKLTPAQILSLLKKSATVKVEVNTSSGVKKIPLLNAGEAVWAVK